MRLTRYFLPTMKETPAEAQIVSHRLMLRAGMIRQASAGIYSWLPLGYNVLRKIEAIVHEEQQRAGAIPVLMPTIQSADLWRQSGRYDAYGPEMLRIEDRGGREMLYGPTNEEQITEIAKAGIKSYRDLPVNMYHIQWKFRDEVRPRFGVMRGREFLMKDAYSFDIDREGAQASYNRMFVSYLRTFERLGLKAVPMRAESGPIGGDMAHEFLILADTGESEVFLDRNLAELTLGDRGSDYWDASAMQAIKDEWTSSYARTEDEHDQATFEAEVPEDRRISARGIEVGHIFYFGTKYSEPLGAKVVNAEGNSVPLEGGSYGIGVSRLVGGIIEASHDDKGIIWPESVAPFEVAVVNLKQGDADTDAACESLYEQLGTAGFDVLYDDRNERAGGKFATVDLIGCPWKIVVGPRGLKEGTIELANRRTGEAENLTPDAVMNRLASHFGRA